MVAGATFTVVQLPAAPSTTGAPSGVPDWRVWAVLVGVVLAAGASRIIRAAALAVSRSEYVAAAKATGATDYRVLWRHILPNVIPTIIVVSTAQVGSAILIEATLGFLGYGVPPPVPTWGQMLSLQGMTYFTTRPLLAIWPGLAIILSGAPVYWFWQRSQSVTLRKHQDGRS